MRRTKILPPKKMRRSGKENLTSCTRNCQHYPRKTKTARYSPVSSMQNCKEPEMLSCLTLSNLFFNIIFYVEFDCMNENDQD